MQDFIKNFRRDGLGSWTCVVRTEFVLSTGRIQVAPLTRFTRGTEFMGVDIAQLLDDEYAKTHPAP